MDIKTFEGGWQWKLPNLAQIPWDRLVIAKDFLSNRIEQPIKHYKVFDSYTDAINHLFYAYTRYFKDTVSSKYKPDYQKYNEESLSNHFYEVIRDEHQKMYFDFDCKDGTQIERCHELVTLLETEIINELNQTYKQNASHNDILIFSSSNHQKISYHIVVYTFCVKGTKENKQFYLDVMKRMKPYLQPQEEQYFDNLYKSTQLLRILYSAKIGTTRRKQLLTERSFYGSHDSIRYEHKGQFFDDMELYDKEKQNALSMLHQLEDSLIQNTKHCKVIDVGMEVREHIVNPFEGHYNQHHLEQLVENKFGNTHCIEWDRSQPDYIWLKRLKSSFCQTCNREHEHENGYLSIRPDTISSANVFYCCRRTEKLQHIGHLSCTYPSNNDDDEDSDEDSDDDNENNNNDDKKEKQKRGTYDIDLDYDKDDDSVPINQDEPKMSKTEYIPDKTRAKYRLKKEGIEKKTIIHTETMCSRYLPDLTNIMKQTFTCIIESDLGTGKSTRMREFLKQHPTMSILFICNRRTYIMDLSASIERDLGRPLYNYSSSDKKEIDASLAISCVESLHKLDRVYDCVVVDECTSILSQLSSALSQNHEEIKELFTLQIKNSRYVFFMDANIDSRSFELLHDLRSQIIYHVRNMYRPRSDYSVTEYREFELIEQVKKSIKENKNIVIVSSTKEYVETVIRPIISDVLSNEQFRIYTGDDRSHMDDLSHVDEVWSTMRCIVYTSTITVGVNFDKEHFDSIFFFLSPQGTIARESFQQSSRVRKLRDKKIDLCFVRSNIEVKTPYQYNELIEHINHKITLEKNHIDQYRNVYKIQKTIKGYENKLFSKIDVGDILTHIAVHCEIERVKSKIFYRTQIESMFRLITSNCQFLLDSNVSEKTVECKEWNKQKKELKAIRKSVKKEEIAKVDIITDTKKKAEIEKKIISMDGNVSKEDMNSVKKTNLMDLIKEDKRKEIEKNGELLLSLEENQVKIRTLIAETLPEEELAYKDIMKEINDGKLNKKFYLNRKKIVEGVWRQLGIKHSLDTKVEIHQDVLLSKKEYWESIYADVKECFGYRGEKDFTVLRNVVNFVNCVFTEWSGIRLTSERKREKGERVNIYKITIPKTMADIIPLLRAVKHQ